MILEEPHSQALLLINVSYTVSNKELRGGLARGRDTHTLTGISSCSTSPSEDSTAVITGVSPSCGELVMILVTAAKRDLRCGWREWVEVGLLRILRRESSDT